MTDLPTLTYMEQPLKLFPYVGSHLSQKAAFETEIQYRIWCTGTSSRKLRNRVFDNHNLRKKTKVMVYKAVCITTLLYGSEAWVAYRCHLKTLVKSTKVASERFFVSYGKIAAPTCVYPLGTNTTSIEATVMQNQHR